MAAASSAASNGLVLTLELGHHGGLGTEFAAGRKEDGLLIVVVVVQVELVVGPGGLESPGPSRDSGGRCRECRVESVQV